MEKSRTPCKQLPKQMTRKLTSTISMNKLKQFQKMPHKRMLSTLNQNCLSNIVQLTEEHQQQGKTIIQQNIQNQINIQNVNTVQVQNKHDRETKNMSFFSKIKNIFGKSLNCISYTFSKFRSSLQSDNINIGQSQISEMLSKLRKKKSKKISLLPQIQTDIKFNNKSIKKRTLVLGLEQTLVLLSFKKLQRYDFTVQIYARGKISTVYIVKRFGLDSFLFQMSKIYQIVIWSSLKLDQIQQIVDKLDPKSNISYTLSAQHSLVINKTYYIKPLKDLGRNCKNIIVVDSCTISASLNPENLYKIQPFRGSAKDRKLIKLGYFLQHIQLNKQIDEIIPIQRTRKFFQAQQIRLNLNNQNKQKKSCSSLNKLKTSSTLDQQQSQKQNRLPKKKKNSKLQNMDKNQEQSSVGIFIKN